MHLMLSVLTILAGGEFGNRVFFPRDDYYYLRKSKTSKGKKGKKGKKGDGLDPRGL